VSFVHQFKMKLVLSLCLLLYALNGTSARFRNYADDFADPIADEISEFLEESDGCNVIIAAEDKLEHMHQNDYVPVQIYSHALCKADDKYCIKPRKRLQRSPNCVRVLFTAEEKSEEIPSPDLRDFPEDDDDEAKSDDDEVESHDEAESESEDDDEVKSHDEAESESEDDYADYDADEDDGFHSSLDKDFVSAVSSLAEEHTTEPMAIRYFWMTPESAEEPQPKTSLISRKWFKRWSFNLYQVVVSPDTRVSRYYFLCQFCDQQCDRMVPIPVNRSEAVGMGKISKTFLSKVLKRRTWDVHRWSQTDQLYEDNSKVISKLKQMDISNPFDIQSEHLSSYTEYFATKFILDHTNSRLIGKETSCRVGTIYYRETRKEKKWRRRGTNYVLGGVESFSFLTCHTTEKISFESYILPFDIYTWVGILVSLAGMMLPIAVYERNANAAQRLSLFEHLCVFVTTALNSCYPFPRLASQYMWYRLMAVAWFFAVLVLSNHYTSIAISDLTKSLPNHSISTFNELVEFRACDPPESPCKTNEIKGHFDTLNPFPWEQRFKTYSTPVNGNFEGSIDIEWIQWIQFKFGHAIRGSLLNYFHGPGRERRPELALSPSEVSLLSLMNLKPESYLPSRLMKEKGTVMGLNRFLSEIEEELVSSCQYKVYADPTEYVDAEYQYLSRNYHWLNFKVSKEKVLFEEHYMGFKGDFGHTMSKTYRVLQESGILNHMNKYYREHLYRKRLSFTRSLKKAKVSESTQDVDQPTKLSGSIQTVFYIYLALIGVSYIVFGFEMQLELICYLLRKLIRGCNNVNVRAGFVQLVNLVGAQVVRLSLRVITSCRQKVNLRFRRNKVVRLRPRRARQGRQGRRGRHVWA
jgi:hypothetical protein